MKILSTWFLVNLASTRCGDFRDNKISGSLSREVLEPRKNPTLDFWFHEGKFVSAFCIMRSLIRSHLPSPETLKNKESSNFENLTYIVLMSTQYYKRLVSNL